MAPHVEDGLIPETTSTAGDGSLANNGGYSKKNILNGHSKDSEVDALLNPPLQLKGVLEQYSSFDVTPVIGKEFPDANLAEWLGAPNSDELIKDLAITVSQRGVVFFRAQDGLTDHLQKELGQRLGELVGKPESSKLHIHPVSNSSREQGGKDDELSIISSVQAKKIFKGGSLDPSVKKQSAKGGWHSDITFEPVPSDYAILRLTELPSTGGDTLWASGYELYDRLSPAYRQFLSTLTATYSQPAFSKAAETHSFPLYTAPRGSPENIGSDLTAIHPVIRTNPVTGWRSIFAVGHHVEKVNEVTADESRSLLK
ncbi:MAG: hypothetical protein Q9190_003438, partial [Brigantiaea leucoxantha]